MSNLYPSTGDMPTIQPQPSQPVAWAEPVVPQPAAIAPQAHQPVVATGVVVMPSAVAQAQAETAAVIQTAQNVVQRAAAEHATQQASFEQSLPGRAGVR